LAKRAIGQISDDLPEGMFAKYFSLLTEWPNDPHMHGMGED
jgi:hypothetical protein